MRKSTITVQLKADIRTVWDVVTNNEDYEWRSDLQRIEVTGEKTFTEYTRDGYHTDFTITCMEPCGRYEFDMVNKNFLGHWIGEFSESEDGGTTMRFTEQMRVKNAIVELVSRFLLDIKKIQEAYMADLRKKLGE